MYYVYNIPLNIMRIFRQINKKYIPIFEVINNKYLVLYVKGNGFCGIIRSGNKYINKMNNEEEYNKLIKTYCMNEIENLVFLEIVEYNIFDFIKIKQLKINLKTMKFNKKIFNITEFTDNSLFNSISHISNEINNNNDNNDNNDNYNKNKNKKNKDDKDEDKDEEDIKEIEYEYMDKRLGVDIISKRIPTLWIPCKYMSNKMNELKISKEGIDYHFYECKGCKIYNNNNKQIRLINKLNIIRETSSEIMNRIIIDYLLCREYKENREYYKEREYDEENINMVYYKNEDSVYDECIFIF